jgi:hypothetical protein
VSDPSNASASGESSSASDGSTADYTPPKLSEGLTAPLKHPREWLFLVENRLLVAGGFLAVLLVLFFAVEMASSFSDQGLMPLFYVFGALIGGNFTLITIVISISQLVISQQLGAPGDLRQQIEETNQYREAVEESIGREVAPVTPTDFLRLLLDQAESRIDTVSDELDEVSDAGAHEDLGDLLSDLQVHIGQVHALLSRADVGLFESLSVTLQTNYSHDIYEARSLLSEHGDQFPDEVREAIEDLVVRLQQIDVARQYLKTLYMQDELAKISRYLLYTGTPAVVVAILMMHQFAASTQAILDPTTLSTLVPIALTIGVAPLAVLFAFVLRVSTVSQRTVAITPFTTPVQESGDDSDPVLETAE